MAISELSCVLRQPVTISYASSNDAEVTIKELLASEPFLAHSATFDCITQTLEVFSRDKRHSVICTPQPLNGNEVRSPHQLSICLANILKAFGLIKHTVDFYEKDIVAWSITSQELKTIQAHLASAVDPNGSYVKFEITKSLIWLNRPTVVRT